MLSTCMEMTAINTDRKPGAILRLATFGADESINETGNIRQNYKSFTPFPNIFCDEKYRFDRQFSYIFGNGVKSH